MKIETTRVCAAATKNYQKFEFEVTATDVNSLEDVNKLETMVIQEAIKGINKLDVTPEEPKVEVKTERQANPMPPRPANGNNGISVEMKEFTNDKGFTTAYKKCFNKSTGQYFYALVDQKQLAFGWPKTRPYEN